MKVTTAIIACLFIGCSPSVDGQPTAVVHVGDTFAEAVQQLEEAGGTEYLLTMSAPPEGKQYATRLMPDGIAVVLQGGDVIDRIILVRDSHLPKSQQISEMVTEYQIP